MRRVLPVAAVAAAATTFAATVPTTNAVFSNSAGNSANTFAAAASFPTYSQSAAANTPRFQHRSDDAATSTGTAADASVNNRPGVYDQGSDGPSTWWRFNAATGLYSSGLGNNGTVSGPTTTTGPSTTAMVYDGVNDSVAATQPAVTTTTSFTVSAWAYATATGANRTVVSQDGPTVAGFALGYTSANKWQFRMPQASGGGTNDIAVTTAAAATNEWVHLVGVYDDAGDQLRLYVNGQLAGSAARTANWAATGGFTAGRAKTAATPTFGEWFTGRIDDVRAYPRALTAADVAILYATPSLRWGFDEGAGTRATDGSGNALTGVVTDSGAGTADPTWTASGKFGNAIVLDGTDDHVEAPAGSTVVRTDKSFSVSAWVYQTTLGASHRAIASKLGTNSSAFILKYNGTLTKWEFVMPNADTNNPTVSAIGGPTAVLNTWTHLLAVYDESLDNMSLYVDGRLGGSGPAPPTPWNATGLFDVGRTKWAGSMADQFPGRIDDVRVYDHALNRADASLLYQRPIARYDLEEGAGTTAGDLSANNHDGTLTGAGATWSTSGRNGNALSFSGATGYVAAAPAVTTTGSYSVSAWVYLTSSAATRTIISQEASTDSAFELRYVQPANKWSMRSSNNAGGGTVAALSSSTAATNRWTHLVGIYDATAQKLMLYVNGSLNTQPAQTVSAASGGSLLIGAGRAASARNNFFYGRIDEPALYDRVLTATEITNLYDESFSGAWEFDENTGSSTADWSQNNNTATTHSTSWTSSGHSSNAITYNGTSGYLSANDSVDTTKNYTVAAWVYLTSNSANRKIFSQNDGHYSAFNLMSYANNKWAIESNDSNGNNYGVATSIANAQTNTWVHVVGMYDANNDMLLLYVNGVYQGLGLQSASMSTSSGSTLIGAGMWNDVRGDYFVGRVDEVRTFRRVLTAQEVAALYSYGTVTSANPEPVRVPVGLAGQAGALQGAQQGEQASTSVAFNGTGNAYNTVTQANPTGFSMECWFKVASGGAGGALMGFSTDATDTSDGGSWDRVLYLTDAGVLAFGVDNGSIQTVNTVASYNDGAWHHAVASSGANGMELYVDGLLKDSKPAVTTAKNYTGYWRWGGAFLQSAWNRPANDNLVGLLDEVAVYPSQLTSQQVAHHYHANH